VVGEAMVEGMVDMITTKEVMVDMDTRVDMDTKGGMATREDMATIKVVMEGMVTTKVDMEDMKMVAGTTTGTEVVVVAGAVEEATGDMVVQEDMNVQVRHMNVVAEVEVAQAAEAMPGAVDEWAVAVGEATKTIRSTLVGCASPVVGCCMKNKNCGCVLHRTEP
jgi:hypothetical protein